MKLAIKLLLIFLLLGLGVFLIYITAFQFLEEISLSELVFDIGGEIVQEAGEVAVADYLAPDFTLTNLKGEEVKLEDYQGKMIILNFWTTWNPAAQDQLAILEAYFQQLKDKEEIVLLTINNLEDKTVVANFIRRGQYDLPVLLDETGEVGELYGISTLPLTFFINQAGRVKESFVAVLSKEEIQQKVEKLYAL